MAIKAQHSRSLLSAYSRGADKPSARQASDMVVSGSAGSRAALLCRRGATAVEFALIVPIFTFMLFSIIEFGFVFVAYGSMHFAATSTARQVGVNTLSPSGAESLVKSRMPKWVANASTVTTTPTSDANPLKNTVKITVSAPVKTATPLPYFTLAPSWVLSTSVTVRRELLYEDAVAGGGGGGGDDDDDDDDDDGDG